MNNFQMRFFKEVPKIVFLVFGAGLLFSPFFVFAAGIQSVPEVKVQDFLNQLQNELLSLQKKDFLMKWGGLAHPFQGNLYVGAPFRNDISRLQSFLSLKGYFDPNFQTGFFYIKTKKAVVNYQEDNGLPTTGYVGPMTRKVLESDFMKLVQSLRLEEVVVTTSTLPAEVTVVGDLIYKKYERPSYDMDLFEKSVFEAVNNERLANRLPILQWSNDLATVARNHSLNQAIENRAITSSSKPCFYPFIHHESLPQGGNVGDRLKNANVFFRAAGENIAMMPFAKSLAYQTDLGEKSIICPIVSEELPSESSSTAERVDFLIKQLEERVHAFRKISDVSWVLQEWFMPKDVIKMVVQGWMNSPGHRANILRNGFYETGIGAARVNDFVIFTQVFLTR